MSVRDTIEAEKGTATKEEISTDLFRALLDASPDKTQQTITRRETQSAVIIGDLIGMTNEGRTPLVQYPGQPGAAALFARTVIDLHGSHVGRQVVLMFESNDASRPIIMGVLREGEGWPLDQQPGQVEVDVNGERMIVSAKEQLVLRCGKASITLTKAGEVLVNGSYLLSRSSGVNHIKGGSIQLN